MDAEDPSSPTPEPPRNRRGGPLRDLAIAIELPFILVGGVIIGGAAGVWLDSKAHTAPLFMFLLGLIGFGAGLREILRRIPKGQK